MCPFKVGDFVQHKLKDVSVRMIVCAVSSKILQFPIGCRWWNEEKKEFKLGWFAVEELELGV